MTTHNKSRSAAIAAKCRDCIYGRKSPGTWREQVAACESANCALHDFRPVPRQCIKDGAIDPAAISEVRAKLDRAIAIRNANRR